MKLPFKFEREVRDIIKISNKYIVIFAFEEFSSHESARNMSAYDEMGNEIWTAELQSDLVTEAWTNFVSNDPLKVSNFSGYCATLDPNTGKILEFEETR